MAWDKEARRVYQRQWEAANRERINAKQRERYANDERRRHRVRPASYREKRNAQQRSRYAERREELLAYQKEYRDKNLEAVRARRRAWVKANRGHASALWAKWNAAKFNACPRWVDWEALKAIYREASRLTRETGIQHDVDHIVPLQSDVVCGLHVPWNMQVLTHAENASKGNRVA